MTRRPRAMTVDDEALLREASDWLMRLRDAGQNPETSGELDAWRAISPRHEKMWQATQRMWGLAGEVGPAPAPALPPVARRRDPARSSAVQKGGSRKRLAWAAGLAAALAVVVLSPLPILLQSDYHTGTGERRTVALADGSKITLDGGSAIAVDEMGSQRRVRLVSGRAFFDVAHDGNRPFSVKADDVTVTVTGTAFDVALGERAVDIALERGAVRVNWPEGDGSLGRLLKPGEHLAVDRGDHAIRLSDISANAIASWRRGRLVVDGTTVGQAIEELSRYHHGRIVVTSDAIAARRVAGVYDLDDPVRAVELLVQPLGGKVRQITPWLLIVSER